jgi:hypothetical protein
MLEPKRGAQRATAEATQMFPERRKAVGMPKEAEDQLLTLLVQIIY